MRVRATGSPGVTTVNAVQTTVRGEGARRDEGGKKRKGRNGSDRQGEENRDHPKMD